jgi:hypothetical protein
MVGVHRRKDGELRDGGRVEGEEKKVRMEEKKRDG